MTYSFVIQKESHKNAMFVWLDIGLTLGKSHHAGSILGGNE